MSDLVERLRDAVLDGIDEGCHFDDMRWDAADRITELEAKVQELVDQRADHYVTYRHKLDELEAALDEIVKASSGFPHISKIALTALGDE